jgi:hypothetical protein
MLSNIAGISIMALVLGVIVSGGVASVAAQPTEVTEIRGNELVAYKEATGAPLKDRLKAAEIRKYLPFDILDKSPNGRYQIRIDGEVLWIPKAQAVTNEGVSVGSAAKCQSISKGSASTRNFSDCKK